MTALSAQPLRVFRRGLLTSAAALVLAALAAPLRRAEAATPMPEGAAFSFDLLTDWMRARAARPHEPPAPPEGFLGALDYDDYRNIRFRPDRARWQDPGDAFRLHAFHTGWLFGEPVQMFDVSAGTVQPMPFSTDDFSYDHGLADRVPAHAALPGVAGFRLHHPLNRPDVFDELVAFLGASYFRALGQGSAYGLSARGLALNTGTGRPEEFPRFTAFYMERPVSGATEVALSAALESESVTGAYRFVIRPGRDTVMEVTARLFFRADVELVGLAPLTSMFLFDEKNRAAFDDYRPKVHDSNGLRMVMAGGDVLWRPLNNPAGMADSWFKGPVARFGLMQRDRDFDNYQDTEAHYERRPSLEVELLGDWGAGAVRLVELPTDLEVNDNIVALWVPEAKGAVAGQAIECAYRLHWGDLAEEAADDAVAVVAATRAGAAGVSGVSADEKPGMARKFVVDFAGPMLANLPQDAAVAPVVTLSAGTVVAQTLQRIGDDGMWRLVIDVAAPGARVVELSAHLAGFGRKLSETWLFQWVTEA